jgi:hypothetical protein
MQVVGPGTDVERSVSAAAALAFDGGAISAGAELVRTAPNVVSITWDGARYPMVVVRDPADGATLALARGGNTQVRTAAHQLELNFYDGVRSFPQVFAVR